MAGKRNNSRHRKPPRSLPLLGVQLALDAGEVMTRRFMMMADGSCTPAEYQRMLFEKILAAQRSTFALMTATGAVGMRAALAPWHRGARANVKRLRKRNRRS